jgi:hypothetical protein
MFHKLLGALDSANFKSAVRQRRLACPACSNQPRATPSAADDVITCDRCGTAASALEWSSTAPAPQLVANPDEPPASTRITRETGALGAITWNIPASGKSGGLIFFAAFWCLITAVVTGAAVFSEKGPRWEGGDPVNPWFLVLFLGVFWAVGIGMAYAACRSKYAKHRLIADAKNITLRRELFGRAKEKSLPAESVESISAVEFYQRNYQPVHGIEIRSPQGKLRFGSTLMEPEKAWLIADLKRVILGTAAASATANAAVAPKRPAAPGRGEFFSVLLPPAPGRLLLPGLMLVAISVTYVLFAWFVMDRFMEPHRADPGGSAFGSPFDMFARSFRVISILMASIPAAIGIALLTRYARTRHQQTRLEGANEEVAIRVTKFGRIVHQRVFPRAEVRDVRASASGTSNGKTMKRIELLAGQKAHSLSRWIDGEKADALVAEARRGLFPPSGTV